jgi:hypothetical protein
MKLNFSEITNGGFVQAQLSPEQSLAYKELNGH